MPATATTPASSPAALAEWPADATVGYVVRDAQPELRLELPLHQAATGPVSS